MTRAKNNNKQPQMAYGEWIPLGQHVCLSADG